MTAKTQLRRTRTRLQRQGVLLFHQTREAGETFFTDSRTATTAFAGDMKGAGDKLVGSLSRSADGLRKALLKEAFDWQKLVLKTRDAYVSELQSRVAELRGRVAPAISKSEARSAKAEAAPIRNYDQLTAKDVVSRVQRLSGPQATAVLDYERTKKNRATVIRAAEKRLASAV